MPADDTDYQRLLEAESKKWGNHLQVESAGRWASWLDHPLVRDNYLQRGLVEGAPWEKWVRQQLGRPAARCMDLGCGAGSKSFKVHHLGAAAVLEGYDISSARVAHAEELRLASRIPGKFQVGDVNRLKLPPSSYDLIFSNHSFHHFLQLEDIMEQVHQALTPGGFFVLEEYVGPTQFQWTEEQMSLVSTRLSMIPERFRISSASGAVKFAESRPSVEEVVAESPFESIRSGEIGGLFQKHFKVVLVRPLGGTLQQLLYNGIAHHFPVDDEEALGQVRGIMALENELIDSGLLPSDFMLLVGQRKTTSGGAFGRPAQPASEPVHAGGSAFSKASEASPPAGRNGSSHALPALAGEPQNMLKRNWQIGICGTFDVANYGDLLFPLIAESELAQRLGGTVTLHRFSYNGKTPPHWPYKVTSVADLPHMIRHLDGMLIGGGFLIRFDKHVAPGYAPPNAGIHHPTGYWLSPALLALQNDVPLVWNAPGMHCNEIPAWADPLMKTAFTLSRYVSVRDESSGAALERLTETPVAVVPDTAFRISRLLNLGAAPSAEFTRLRETSRLDGPYIVIQATMGLEGFVGFVKQHAEQFRGFRFLALPIGPVLGEDTSILDATLPGLVCLPAWPDPLVIAELISHAEAVVGHSYHLMVTALAAGVPIFTGQDMTAGKYSALHHFDTIHSLPADGQPEPGWFLSRMGRVSPPVALRAIDESLCLHWDRIAEAILADKPRTSIALNQFWQRLPTLLENMAVQDPVTLLPGPAPGDGTETQRRLDDALRQLDETTRLLSATRAEIDARDLHLAEVVASASWRQAVPPAAQPAPAADENRRPQTINVDLIRRHQLETSPFHWACIKDLYLPEDAARLAATYPCDHFKLLSSRGGEKDYEYEARSLIGMGATEVSHPAGLSEAWKSLAHDLLSPEYRAAMTKLTGLDLAEAPMEVNVFHYGPGCSLGAHCDLPDKVVTHVLYFNRSWNPQEGGCLSILRSSDLKDIATEIPPLVGNSAVLVRADNSWHAVSRVVSGSAQSRRSVTVTFYRPGSTSSMWPPNDTTPLHHYHAADLLSEQTPLSILACQ